MFCWIICGISPNAFIPSTEMAFGNTFFMILYAPFTSALSKIPLEVMNKPLEILFPAYFSCFNLFFYLNSFSIGVQDI